MYRSYDRRPVKAEASANGIGFFGLLFIVLLTLKLTNYINWSWWWITAPLWGPPAVLLGLGLVALVVYGVIKLFSKKK